MRMLSLYLWIFSAIVLALVTGPGLAPAAAAAVAVAGISVGRKSPVYRDYLAKTGATVANRLIYLVLHSVVGTVVIFGFTSIAASIAGLFN
ncbi:MAG: hypothetical protein IBX71_10205 [Candidatus Desulforudis sp.]|nr:hypothetical protein [Desulforudis sp.]